MIKKGLLILFNIILIQSVYLQESFELIYDNFYDFGKWSIELNNGNYLTMGDTSDSITNLAYPLLLIYSDSISYEYHTYPKQDTSYSIRHGIQKANGDFIFIGNLYNATLATMATTIYLCGMNSDFELQWEKYYPLPDDYYLKGGDILMDQDNNIVLSAGLSIDFYSNTLLYLTKFNMEGELLAEKFFPDFTISMYNDIIPKSDNSGYIILGYVVYGSGLAGDYLELDSEFNISTPWINGPINGETYLSEPVTAKWLENGNLFLVNRGTSDMDAQFRIYDSEFNIIQDTAIVDPPVDYTPVRQGMDFVDEDMIWINTFNMHLFPISYDHIFRIYLYDSEMNIKGMKTYGGDGQWWFEHLLATSDGGCIITGGERELGSDFWDIYILKVMPEDVLNHAEDTPMENDRDVALYPNPVKDFIQIETIRKNLTIYISDNLGRIIAQKEINSFPRDAVNLSHLKGGIYFYHIMDGSKKIQSGKFMKQ